MNYVVIFAGGIGSRMQSKTPKQFLKVAGKPILIHTVEVFDHCDSIDGIVVVCKKEFITVCRDYLREYHLSKVIDVIEGGDTGQESIYNGLSFLMSACAGDKREDIVLIHDGVRPVIDEELINRSILNVKKNGNSIAVANAVETILKVDEFGTIVETLDRSICKYAKAPQCFYLKDIWEVHLRAKELGITNSVDSATLMSSFGVPLHATECSQENIKITTPNDYYMFKGMYESSMETSYEVG